MWSKILENKLSCGNKLSLHSLELFQRLSDEDIVLFKKYYPYIVNSTDNSCGFVWDSEIYSHLNVDDMLRLTELGLIFSDDNIELTLKFKTGSQKIFWDKKYKIMSISNQDRKGKIKMHFLTTAGKELYDLFEYDESKCIPLIIKVLERDFPDFKFSILDKNN